MHNAAMHNWPSDREHNGINRICQRTQVWEAKEKGDACLLTHGQAQASHWPLSIFPSSWCQHRSSISPSSLQLQDRIGALVSAARNPLDAL